MTYWTQDEVTAHLSERLKRFVNERVEPDTASARILPDWICGTAPGSEVIHRMTRPLMRSVCACEIDL